MRTGIVKDSLIVSLNRYLILGFGIARSFAVARLLGPDGYSYWLLFLLALNYLDQVHLGLRHAGDKEIPFTRGQGDESETRRIADTLLGGILVFSVLAAVIVVSGAFILFSGTGATDGYRHDVLRTGLFMTAAVMVADQVSRYFLMLLRTRKSFVQSAMVESTTEFIRTALVVLLGYLLLLNGVVIAYVIASAGMAGWFLLRERGNVRARIDRPRLARLLRTGIPLFINGLVILLILSLDRVVGGGTLAKVAFGQYGFAASLILLPVYASYGIRDVLFPVFGEAFGKADDPSPLADMLIRTEHAVAYALPLLLFVVLFPGEAAIRLLLPKFVPAISIMVLLSGGVLFLATGMVPNAVLLITNRSWHVIGIELLSIAAGLACFVLLNGPLSAPAALAMATCVLYAVFGVCSVLLALLHCHVPVRALLVQTAWLCLPTLWSIALIAGLTRLLPAPEVPTVAAVIVHDGLKLALASAAFAPVLYFVQRNAGLVTLARSVLRRKG